jgi:maltose O-acetyltransferase
VSINAVNDSHAVAEMLSGRPYLPFVPELTELRLRAKKLCHRYNASFEAGEREALLAELLGGTDGPADIEPPFFCDYGFNIVAGAKLYMNHGCVLLDCNGIQLGDGVMLGPAVHIYTVNHPLDPGARRAGYEYTAPVRIGSNVWIGGGAIICPDVTIGDNTVVGAGSVVTKSLPANVLAVGNPCRVLRPLEPAPSAAFDA